MRGAYEGTTANTDHGGLHTERIEVRLCTTSDLRPNGSAGLKYLLPTFMY
jgi:hypothetical protein